MLNPFIELISAVIYLFNAALIIWLILSWLISFNIVNRQQPVVARVFDFLSKITEPVLRPIRKVVPIISGIDISPIILILALNFLNNALYHYFYKGIYIPLGS